MANQLGVARGVSIPLRDIPLRVANPRGGETATWLSSVDPVIATANDDQNVVLAKWELISSSIESAAKFDDPDVLVQRKTTVEEFVSSLARPLILRGVEYNVTAVVKRGNETKKKDCNLYHVEPASIFTFQNLKALWTNGRSFRITYIGRHWFGKASYLADFRYGTGSDLWYYPDTADTGKYSHLDFLGALQLDKTKDDSSPFPADLLADKPEVSRLVYDGFDIPVIMYPDSGKATDAMNFFKQSGSEQVAGTNLLRVHWRKPDNSGNIYGYAHVVGERGLLVLGASDTIWENRDGTFKDRLSKTIAFFK